MGLSASGFDGIAEWADACDNATQDDVRYLLEKNGVKWTNDYCDKFEVCVLWLYSVVFLFLFCSFFCGSNINTHIQL